VAAEVVEIKDQLQEQVDQVVVEMEVFQQVGILLEQRILVAVVEVKVLLQLLHLMAVAEL
jgi:hypothetical protein